MERPEGMPNIVSLEVMCGKDHMDVHLTFSHPFEGIVSSKGTHLFFFFCAPLNTFLFIYFLIIN